MLTIPIRSAFLDARNLSGNKLAAQVALPAHVKSAPGIVNSRAGQAFGAQLRNLLPAQSTKPASAPATPNRQPVQRRLADHAGSETPLSAVRSAQFFLGIVRADGLEPGSQARELQSQARRLAQLDPASRAGGFTLILRMAGKLPHEEQARVLTTLTPRLRSLPASERSASFDAIAASIAKLPPAQRAQVLPALTKTRVAGRNDSTTFHALQQQVRDLPSDAQQGALPGLIRRLGVLPEASRKAAFDTLAAQVQALPSGNRANSLKGLAGKVRTLPADQQAAARTLLHNMTSALPQPQRGDVSLLLQTLPRRS